VDTAAGLEALLSGAGLNLTGALAPREYDALVPPAWRCAELLPEARTVLVIGSGGRALWDAVVASIPDPVDRHTERALADGVAQLASAGFAARAAFAHEQRGGAFADLVALGRAAGLGAPSRLGLLVHPRYGPWLSLRALLFTSLPIERHPGRPDFDPCPDCPAPCAETCHGAAVEAARFSIPRCAAARQVEPRCALRCDARHACVLGREHAYPEAAEAHHMRSALSALVESGNHRP
jgi:hypothetical protein